MEYSLPADAGSRAAWCMPAALRYTRMGPPTLAVSAVRSERAAASKLQSSIANTMLADLARGSGGIYWKTRELLMKAAPGENT